MAVTVEMKEDDKMKKKKKKERKKEQMSEQKKYSVTAASYCRLKLLYCYLVFRI